MIITTGVWDSGKTGAELSAQAFERGIPFNLGAELLAISLAIFAFSTILGWSYYGEKAIQYLFKEKAVMVYRAVFTVIVLLGAVAELELVWLFADIMNGLMAFPNLVGLIGLSGVITLETRKYLISELKYK